MHTLHLTTGEMKLFAALQESIRADCIAEAEKLSFQDSPELRAIRFGIFRPTDPEIIRFRDAAKNAKTDQELAALAETLNMKKIGDSQLTQMLFTLGPTFMDIIVMDILSRAASADDVELAAAFSALRHAMLESYSEISA